MTLGVVIVTYNAKAIIRDCLESLTSGTARLRIVVVDNASTDGTTDVIKNWASGADGYAFRANMPFKTPRSAKPVTNLSVIAAPQNGGFAAGVNIGLAQLMAQPCIDRFWILNPDTFVPPQTPAAIAAAPDGFALMGGRILYADPPFNIQIDAGTLNRWTGVTGNINLGAPGDAGHPDMQQADFISGAHMVASRGFVEAAGPMPEHYFLYYEEVDWAQRRGNLPLTFCPGAPVYHRAGSSIGSPTLTSAASPLSVYYKHRARISFLRSHNPLALPSGYAYGAAKAAQSALHRQWPQTTAALRALSGLPLLADKAP